MSESKLQIAGYGAKLLGIGEIAVGEAAPCHYVELFVPEVGQGAAQRAAPVRPRHVVYDYDAMAPASGAAPATAIKAAVIKAFARRWQPPQHFHTGAFEMDLETATIKDEVQLQDALAELDGVTDEAREEGHEVPPPQAIQHARRLVEAVHCERPAPIEVFATEERDVHIHVQAGFRRSVTVICESAGSAHCLVNLNGQHRRAFYSTADQLPDNFLKDGLAEIDGR